MHPTRTNSALFFSALVGLAGLIACTPAVSVPQAEYREIMASVKTGMSKQAFLNLFPKAEARGAKALPGGSIDALEVVIYRYHFGPTSEPEWFSVPGGQVKKIWFYFYQDKLVQYGQQNEWPDLISGTKQK